GNVYVTDEWMNRVTVYTSDGDLIGVWGQPGTGDGMLNRPNGIAFDANGDVWIVDSLNHRLQKFTKDGRFLAKFGEYGKGEGRLDSPWGMTIDNQGDFYVADHKNHRVQKFSPDGRHLMTFGSFGTGRGELTRPTGVAVDPDGDVYVVDWWNNRVQIFDKNAKFLATLVGDAVQMAKWHFKFISANPDVLKARRRVYTLEPEWRFALPVGIAFDTRRSRVFVTDSQRWRVQVYNKLSDYREPQYNL
ncbi:MAG: NHL repeat-containing protein, partial [Chloroflexi bacterium]|nr:NHL repeat-containing protein [Chloroflexota bacterium]